jgi:hypothetical protein
MQSHRYREYSRPLVPHLPAWYPPPFHLPGCSTLPRCRHTGTESTVDLLFHTYLLGILLLSTYLAALVCQDVGTQVQQTSCFTPTWLVFNQFFEIPRRSITMSGLGRRSGGMKIKTTLPPPGLQRKIRRLVQLTRLSFRSVWTRNGILERHF